MPKQNGFNSCASSSERQWPAKEHARHMVAAGGRGYWSDNGRREPPRVVPGVGGAVARSEDLLVPSAAPLRVIVLGAAFIRARERHPTQLAEVVGQALLSARAYRVPTFCISLERVGTVRHRSGEYAPSTCCPVHRWPLLRVVVPRSQQLDPSVFGLPDGELRACNVRPEGWWS